MIHLLGQASAGKGESNGERSFLLHGDSGTVERFYRNKGTESGWMLDDRMMRESTWKPVGILERSRRKKGICDEVVITSYMCWGLEAKLLPGADGVIQVGAMLQGCSEWGFCGGGVDRTTQTLG